MMNKIKTWCRGVVKGFLDNQCSMHAAGLTYFSMLAMMPILCCILVVAKAVGVDDYARTHINERIDALITHIEKGQDDELAAGPFPTRSSSALTRSTSPPSAGLASVSCSGRSSPRSAWWR